MKRKINNPNQLSLFETYLEKVIVIEKPKKSKDQNVVFVKGIFNNIINKVDIKSVWFSDDYSMLLPYLEKARSKQSHNYLEILKLEEYYNLFGAKGTRKK